ncbi:MAG: hypothetical protein U1E38_00605 [Rhodospirillales bacterium]
MPDAPKVFISCWQPRRTAHETRVLELANRLREDGDAEIDQYEVNPDQVAVLVRMPDQAGELCAVSSALKYTCAASTTKIRQGPWRALRSAQRCASSSTTTCPDDRHIPVLLDGGLPAFYIPLPVKARRGGRWRHPRATRPLPPAHPPARGGQAELGKVRPMPPRQSRSGAAAAVEAVAAPAPRACAAASNAPHARVRDVFVGRKAQLAVLTTCLLPEDAGGASRWR